VTPVFVLDSSAILALTDREEGWEAVELLLNDAQTNSNQVCACAISLMEIYYIAIREIGDDAAAKLVAIIKSWPVTWIYPDEKTFLLAGKLKAAHRLSLADALIAAVAKLQNATLVHKDPELESLGSELQLLSLPYKKKV
jgi:predicted nucleic acid-binding protein